MVESQWKSFCDNYVNEMIQAEKELEKKAFYDNMSSTEKHLYQWTKKISEQMAKNIDREIISDLFKISQIESGNTINVTAVIRPVVQTINLDFTITPDSVTFDT